MKETNFGKYDVVCDEGEVRDWKVESGFESSWKCRGSSNMDCQVSEIREEGEIDWLRLCRMFPLELSDAVAILKTD